MIALWLLQFKCIPPRNHKLLCIMAFPGGIWTLSFWMIGICFCQITFQNGFTNYIPISSVKGYLWDSLNNFFLSSIVTIELMLNWLPVGWHIWFYPLMIFFLKCNHSIISFPSDNSNHGTEVIFENKFSLINIINEPPNHLTKSSLQRLFLIAPILEVFRVVSLEWSLIH